MIFLVVMHGLPNGGPFGNGIDSPLLNPYGYRHHGPFELRGGMRRL